MDDIVKRGYLYQQIISTSCFRNHRSWRRIFALLSDGCLFLFRAPSDLAPLARFPLYAAACIFPQFPKVHRSNCLELETPCASLFLCADSPADMKAWAIAIQKAAIVASGGTLGARSAAAASAAAAAAASSAGVGLSTPQPGTRSLLDGGSSTPARRNSLGGGLNLQLPSFPSDAAAASAAAAASPSRVAAASSLIVEASRAARHEHVLHRFRSGCTVTAFTSNALASLAPAYVGWRMRGKHRVAEEWQREKWRRTQRNLRRQTAPVAQITHGRTAAGAGSGGTLKHGSLLPPPSFGSSSSGISSSGSAQGQSHNQHALIPWSDLDVPSLGTLRLSSHTVLLSCPAAALAAVPSAGSASASSSSPPPTQPVLAHGDLSVTNTADFPVVLRVGDSSTARWLSTSTPRFLEAGASCVLSFEMQLPPPARAATTGSNGTAAPGMNGKMNGSSPAPSAAGHASLAPALPFSLPLYTRPCDSSDLSGLAPLSLFETESGLPVHRVGQRVDLKFKLHLEKHPLSSLPPLGSAAAAAASVSSSSSSSAAAAPNGASSSSASSSTSARGAASPATPAAAASSAPATPAAAMNGSVKPAAAVANGTASAAASPPTPAAASTPTTAAAASTVTAPSLTPETPANPAITPGYRRRKAKAVATMEHHSDEEA